VPKKTPDKKKRDALTGKVEAAPSAAEETTPEASAADVTITPADVTATGQPAATITGTIGTPTKEIGNPIGIFRLPPFQNTAPGIGSISPTSAEVGSGGDLALTVLGSNFGNSSVVVWTTTVAPITSTNLATQVVSATQINATVPAANLAAPGPINVVVQNPGATTGAAPVSSGPASFVITPSWPDIQAQLSSVAAPLPAYVNAYVQNLTMQNNSQATQIQQDGTNYNNLNTLYQTAQATVSQQAATITSLQSQLAASTYQTASPLDVASSFKSVVDQIQQAAQSAGGTQTTVTNMNVQVKSLLSVQGSTATTPATASMTFFSPQSLPPAEHLSTLSFTFGSIPNLKTAAAANAPPPPSSSSSSSSGSSSLSGSSSSTPAPTSGTPAVPGSSSSSSSSATAAPSIARPQSAATSGAAVGSAAVTVAKATAAKKAPSAKKKKR